MAAVALTSWMLHTGGGWGDPPHIEKHLLLLVVVVVVYTWTTILCAFENILVLLIFFIQSFSMAGFNHSRLMAEMVVEMLQKEQDEGDQAILSLDSESEISDADDLCATGKYVLNIFKTYFKC